MYLKSVAYNRDELLIKKNIILGVHINPRAIERGLHWIFYKTEMKIWAVGCGLGWTVLKKGLGRL